MLGARARIPPHPLALLTLVACAEPPGPEPAASTPGLTRLDLRPESSAPVDLEPRLVRRIEIPASPDWHVQAEAWDVIEMRELEARGLFMRSQGAIRADVPGPFAHGSFNQVVVQVVAHGEMDVALMPRSLSLAGRRILRTDSTRVKKKRFIQPIFFELPELRRSRETIDELGIVFTGDSREATLVSVELHLLPWPAWLPDPAGPAQMVRIGGELRRAEGLTASRPLVTTFDAPPGGELAFAYGVPERLRVAGHELTLVFELSGSSGKKRTRRLPFEPDLETAASWHEVTADVGEFAGERVTARFELQVDGEGEGLCALGEPLVKVPAAQPRTVVLVTSDTHRADHVGAAADGVEIATPFLDSLAERGVMFEDCTSTANITNPSHAALMTATSPRDTGVVNNYTRLADDARTLAEAFREAGFATYAVVCADHLADETSGLGQGFDRMTAPDEAQRDSAAALAEARAFLRDGEGLPLFLWLHVFDAHTPYTPPEEYKHLYYPADANPYDRRLPEPDRNALPKWDRTVRDLDYLGALYRSEVTYVDDRLRELFEHPRFERAIVAVTSDHGESLTAHGIYWDHRELYPDTLDVPLILAWPGAPAGTRVARPVNQLDLGRTLLDLSGLEETPFPGKNLLAAVDDGGPRFAVSAMAKSASVQLGGRFLVLHLTDHRFSPVRARRELHEVELYDLALDPACETNLVHERPAEAGRLRALLIEWLQAASADGWIVENRLQSARVIRQLRELGYTDFEPTRTSNEWFDAECECAWCAEFE